MISIPVHTNQIKAYDIVLDDGDPFESTLSHVITTSVSDHSLRKAVIVTDEEVLPLYAEKVSDCLGTVFADVLQICLPAGESYKTLDGIREIYTFLKDHRIERKDVLCALGGGVIGDMTGFAAATWLRGIRFIQLPTTLLSQTDASIGGKTGVDLDGGKNLVGAFYMPSLVYIHPAVLKTLSDRQFASGMAEVIKHGLIRDASYFEMLASESKEILAREPSVMLSVLERGIRIKKEIVEADPLEKGERALLNFGHTIGHAIENALHFRLLHGECVSLGMVAAAAVSEARGLIGQEDVSRIRDLLFVCGLPVTCAELPPDEELLEIIRSDKKSDGGRVRFVLLSAIGNAMIADDVTDEEIANAIGRIRVG